MTHRRDAVPYREDLTALGSSNPAGERGWPLEDGAPTVSIGSVGREMTGAGSRSFPRASYQGRHAGNGAPRKPLVMTHRTGDHDLGTRSALRCSVWIQSSGARSGVAPAIVEVLHAHFRSSLPAARALSRQLRPPPQVRTELRVSSLSGVRSQSQLVMADALRSGLRGRTRRPAGAPGRKRFGRRRQAGETSRASRVAIDLYAPCTPRFPAP